MDLQHVKELEQKFVLGTYARHDLLIDRGSGPYLIDKSNKRYLDLLSGIAVNVLGYNHPKVKQALRKQIKKPLHLSNLFYNEWQGRLAQKMTAISGMDRAFFTNSGTESVEGCLKFARVYARRRHEGRPDKFRILALDRSFHGRTFGSLSATGQEKYRKPFEPLVPGFGFIQFNDVADLTAKLNDDVCAVIVETIQGEGGIRPLSESFYAAARDLTRRCGALLIADEIQCGVGRSGRWFAYQHLTGNAREQRPDLISIAKPMGLGIPMGAILLTEDVASTIHSGDHGTTFGGGPLACRMSLELIKIIEEEKLLDQVADLGAYFIERLETLRDLAIVKEVRGLGLMLAVELQAPGKEVVKKLIDQGYLINCTADTVLRILPPYIITRKHVDKFVATLRSVLEQTPYDRPQDRD